MKLDHQHTTPAAQGLKWSGRTDRGKVRANNEDAFLGIQFDGREVRHLGKIGEAGTREVDYVFAVSDGMGGAKAGEFASRMAMDRISKLLPRSFRQSARGLAYGFPDALAELFDQVHKALVYVGGSYAECAGMEATLSLCWFTPAWMYFGHIGDSRIYHLPGREGGIKQLSEDDTHVGWLRRGGKINEREARNHPRRNVLQKALGGSNQFTEPQVGAVAYEAGDMFVLCTDGLMEGLYDSNLESMLRKSRNLESRKQKLDPYLADLLVEKSLEADGRDNTTAVVVQVT